MDNKKIIIIAILALIIVGVSIIMIMNQVNYEKIEITPNGTTIDAPANQTRYHGSVEGIKVWHWNSGVLVSYNSNEDPIKLTGLGFDGITELVKNGEVENIDGFTCYVINADDLLEIHIFDIIKINYNGKFYCIPLNNESTHDNIIICCKDKDIALHMAKSVQYKNVYPDTTKLDDAISTIDKINDELQSINKTDINNLKSTIEENAEDLLSKSPI